MTVEIALLRPVDSALVEALEEGWANLDLRVTLRGTSVAYPGSTHWHLKRGMLAGTLEATLWPRETRMWLSVQSRRRASWIEEALPEVVAVLERVCGGSE